MIWLVCCLGVLLGGNTMPWILRIAFGLVLVAVNLPALQRAVLLRGSSAVGAIEWDEDGRFFVQAQPESRRLPAILDPASFRLGIAFLVLWFSTPVGRRVVVIDGGKQDRIAFRRLSRHLARGELIPSGPKA